MTRLADFALIAFDMDSTLIDIECIDEIANASGRGEEVRACTADAMAGLDEDFAGNLRRRVALLQGVPEHVLDEVYHERVRITAGAEDVIQAARAAGLATMLVTGGFGYFARRLKHRLGLDTIRCNEVEIRSGRLTGRLLASPTRPVCDALEKRRAVELMCRRLGESVSRAIAVGDGANDIPMIAAAGLGVAYRARPQVRRVADLVLDEGGLDGILVAASP